VIINYDIRVWLQKRKRTTKIANYLETSKYYFNAKFLTTVCKVVSISLIILRKLNSVIFM